MGNVLSNDDILDIIKYSIFAATFLVFIFAKLGARDPDPSYKKGVVAKIVPWVLLLLFLSDAALIISRLTAYPWEIEPQPSKASTYRELMYLGSGHPVWGWANDYQLAVVGQIGGCIVAFCWAVYAFAFKRSNTKWWKKLFKVLAYILLSALIIGFSFHEWRDIYSIAMFLVPAILFLILAHVKPNIKESESAGLVAVEPIKQRTTDADSESNSEPKLISKDEGVRFMPKSVEDETKNVEIGQKLELNSDGQSDNGNENIKNDTQELSDLSIEEHHTLAIDSENRHNSQDQETVIIGDKNENSSNKEISNEDTGTIDTMFCKYCGSKIELDSTFCKYCGKRL